MGHGSDKLFVTHSEHSGRFGQHSASSGYKAKEEANQRAATTPFDCCALSFQPWSHPVCARTGNRGHVFDLVNIIPWLKQHNNTNPITNEPLQPSELISLNYSRKEASGEIHDPISFKPFNENSSIVAIATTGNVFLYESIKGGKDLVADVPFKKYRQDIIILQDPHGQIPEFAAPTPISEKAVSKPAVVKPVAAVKAKEAEPWNVSPYSTGLPGASLTSTSVDPMTASSRLVWDEEELMFEDISNPVKGKGKEKDLGKRRAYVRVVTSLGGGSLNLELYCEKAPKTCYNFLMLARQGKYNDCLFHRLVPGFMVQTGDPTGTGSGGSSYWGTPFRDEHDLKNAAKHDSRGVIAMANSGANTNGSQFYITFKAAPHLDKKHTVFGKLVGGENLLDALEKLPRKDGTERPSKQVRITEVIIYQDPFEDYKSRLARKLARKAEPNNEVKSAKPKTDADQMNWFGTRLGTTSNNAGPQADSGVGKYLSLKRSATENGATQAAESDKKKRKIGFGDFTGW